ncbi:MAG TPA: DUF2079 domain-containing protein [Acidimicrobiales bacterium]
MRLRRKVGRWLRPELALGAMLVAYCVVFIHLTWLQESHYGTFDYDMGIFDQEIWLAAHHLNPFITIRGLDMWANHVNPIIYVLVPFYWLGAGPHFLYVVQTLALAGSAVPLWLLARDRLGNPWLSLGIPVAWLLYPAVEWMTKWPFQPEYLGVPALLFAYWLADRGRWRWYGMCVVLVLATKEDAALPVIALGILLGFRHHRRAGLVTAAGALAWFLVCVEVILPSASPTAAPFFAYQFSSLGDSMGQILYNSVRHPSRILRLAFSHDRYQYYSQMLVPVAGIALLAPATLFLALPTLLVNVTDNQGYTHDIRFQYGAFVAAGVFLAVIEAVGRVRPLGLRRLLVGMVCAFALASNVAWSPSRLNNQLYHSGIWALTADPQMATLDQLVHMVPAGVGVSATYNVVPHLAHRDQIYTFPNPWVRSYYGTSDTEPPESTTAVQYLVLETNGESVANQLLVRRLTKPGGPFRIVLDQNQAILARRVRPGR